MKISLDHRINYHTDTANITRQSSSVSRTDNNNRKYDAVTIHSDFRQISEKTFSESVIKNMSAAVHKNTSVEKIDMLKDQVSNGSYPMNYELLASRILLTQGGSANV